MTRRVVAPCYDCGHAEPEVGEFERGEHEYHVFELWGNELVLCDFCDADFGSYFPERWGLPPGPLPDYPLNLLSKVATPALSEDSYCSKCNHRLAFLRVLAASRARNAA
jgi:hypothetical protein